MVRYGEEIFTGFPLMKLKFEYKSFKIHWWEFTTSESNLLIRKNHQWS